MKKTLIVVGCALLIAPTAFSQVYSANAVGYVKKTVEPGTLDLLRYDFLAIDGSATLVGDVLPADQVPEATRAFFWDASGQAFAIENALYSKAEDKVIWNPGTTELAPGTAFFLEIPGEAAAAVDVVMVGEVPGSNNDSDTTDLPVVEGLTMAGYPYPATMVWDDTTLAQAAAVGDRLFTWDAAGQSYLISNYLYSKSEDKNIWNPGGTVLEPGQGFFYDKTTAGAAVWSENKPYQWP